MMDRKAYLRELGLEEGAQRDDLILAYRRLMIQWHPERTPPSNGADSERRRSAFAAAFSALEKSYPRKPTRSLRAKGSKASGIVATYGSPRFQTASFEATSLIFLPVKSVTELGLTPTLSNVVPPTSNSSQKTRPPIRSTVLIGGTVTLLLFTVFSLVRPETERRESPIVNPAPQKASVENIDAGQVETNPATPAAPPHGRLLARTNRANVTIELRSEGGAVPFPGNRVGDDGFDFPELSPGQYHLTAHLNGWPDISRAITLSDNQDIEVSLAFVGGALRLESDPSNAVVRIGGKAVGRTPMVIKDLPPGSQAIELQYKTWPELRVLAAVEAEREIAKTVRIPYGQLSIGSNPSGATVFIDGEKLGHTPLVANLVPTGIRLLRLTADNYEPYETSISVADRSDLKIQPTLTSSIALLDPNSLLNSVWTNSQQTGRNYDVAPGFERANAFRPKNGVVKNLDRQKLYANWAGRLYRYAGVLKQFEPKTGVLEFTEESGEKSKYKIIAALSARSRSDKDFLNKLLKGARIEVTGRLTATEEPKWPSKTIAFELSDTEAVH